MTFKPLLAATTDGMDLRELPFPLLWSPKLDGIRTLVYAEHGGPVTRKIKDVPNDKIRAALSHPDLFGLDGEIVFGGMTDPEVFNRTQSAVMKIAGPGFDEADGRYLVFDDFSDPDLPFQERFARLETRVAQLEERFPFIKVVPHGLVENYDDLMNIERIVVEKGYEGVMLRSPAGRYKFGRSTYREMILAKIKRFADAEARIVGFEELMHNDNVLERDALGHAKRATLQENLRPGGTLGALIVYSPDYDGIEIALPNGRTAICNGQFKIGSGYTAALKQEIWDNRDAWLGAMVTFKYQPSGMKDLPRFPVFKGRRKD